jgi:hypothetical protein
VDLPKQGKLAFLAIMHVRVLKSVSYVNFLNFWIVSVHGKFVHLVRIHVSQLFVKVHDFQLVQFDESMSRSPVVSESAWLQLKCLNLLLHGAFRQIEVM